MRYLTWTTLKVGKTTKQLIGRGYEIGNIRETTELNLAIMSLISVTKASLQFSRRIIVPPTPPSTLLHFIIPNNIEIKDDINDNNIYTEKSFNGGRRRCYHTYYRHQHQYPIEIESLPSILCRRQFSSTSTNNRNDDDDSSKDQEQSPTLMERTDKNIIQRMYDKFSMSQQTNRILIAESLLQAAASQANDPRWYGPGRIPGDDFRSYQALVTMHMWFLHKRLVSCEDDPHKAALIQEELFDIFWVDSSNRMRSHGVHEMLINKNLKKVQQYTFMHMFHYDHCYTGDLLDDPNERLEELKNLVKTHILLLSPLSDDNDDDDDSEGSDDNNNNDEYSSILQEHRVHDDQAERIAWYIETQYQNIIHDLPESLFQKARIAWVDLPSFEHMIDDTGKELPKQTNPLEDILPSSWVKNIANDGTYYYWNVSTREAQWDRPSA